MVCIGITSASLPAKKRILTVCVKLFLEKGYKRTTLAEIIEKAEVSYSTFQNIFRAKDGVLTELTEFMFSNQFAMARSMTGAQLPPVYVYAVETAIQMTLTELNENLREIYIEAYTQKEASDYIFRKTAKELHQIFGPYQPERTARDFYEMEIGSAGIMLAYMARPCDGELTLEKKLRMFLTLSLRGYKVPEEEVRQILRFVEGLDIRTVAEQVMQKLFRMTPLQDNYSCNFNILVGGAPRVMGVREILEEWSAFRLECVRRRLVFDLQKKQEKLHLLLGLEKILLDIDKAI